MIVMYSKPNCSYCAHARAYMKEHNIPFEEKKLDVDFNRDYIISTYPTAKTYPVIVEDGIYIGGFVDLRSKYRKPVLDEGAWNGA